MFGILMGALTVYIMSAIILLGAKIAFAPELEITPLSTFGVWLIVVIWGSVTVSLIRTAVNKVLKEREAEFIGRFKNRRSKGE